MSEERTAARATRPPALAWNAGGWFGALFGCTCWMLLAGLLVMAAAWKAGTAALLCWALACAWGVLLWRRRARLSAYAGVQWLLVGCTLTAAGTLGALTTWGGAAAAERVDRVSRAPLAGAWWWLLMYPGLMALFALLQRRRAS